MNISKRILEGYSSQFPHLKNLQRNVSEYQEAVKQLDQTVYTNEVKADIRNKMREAVLESYEKDHSNDLLSLKADAEKLKNEYATKMGKPSDQKDRLMLAASKYGAMSNAEIEQLAKDYKTGHADIIFPEHVDALSNELRIRKSESFDGFREKALQRKYNEPYRPMNPKLFESIEALETTPEDHFTIFPESKQNPAAQGIMRGSVNDLFDAENEG